jgi:hypothetical protein
MPHKQAQRGRETMPREIRFCIDCSMLGEITQHGKCSRCGSDAVAIPMHLQEYFAFRDKAIDELERIYELEGRK